MCAPSRARRPGSASDPAPRGLPPLLGDRAGQLAGRCDRGADEQQDADLVAWRRLTSRACVQASATVRASTRGTNLHQQARHFLLRAEQLVFGTQREVEAAQRPLIVAAADGVERLRRRGQRRLADELSRRRALLLNCAPSMAAASAARRSRSARAGGRAAAEPLAPAARRRAAGARPAPSAPPISVAVVLGATAGVR